MCCLFKSCLSKSQQLNNMGVNPPPIVPPMAPRIQYRDLPEINVSGHKNSETSSSSGFENIKGRDLDTTLISKHYTNMSRLIATPAQKWKIKPIPDIINDDKSNQTI